MFKPIIFTALAFSVLIGSFIPAKTQTRAPAQKNLLPTSFKWKSEYLPKGARLWSQTAPKQWTDKYEDGTDERHFRVLGQLSMGDGCAGLHLKSMAEPLEAFIPGSRCSSKWLLFRWVSIYTAKPQWVGQAEIQDVQYAPPATEKSAPR